MRGLIVAALMALPGAGFADLAQQKSCSHQAMIVDAIKAARLAFVAERNVEAHVLKTSPPWPEAYNAAIPLMTPWVYEMRRRDVRQTDLARLWMTKCMGQ